MKSEVGSTKIIDGTPEKRMFLSIIADYDLITSVCELVDNAIDHWTANDRPSGTIVNIFMNSDRQTISVVDNAGGVPVDRLRLLVTPGASNAFVVENPIGSFGVGGKRAGVALGERVEIISRHDETPASKLVLDNDWLRSDSWEIEARFVDEGEVGKTTVRVSNLRQGFDGLAIEHLKEHLGETYSAFVELGCDIRVNGQSVGAKAFDNWAYPPNFPPRCSKFSIRPDGTKEMKISLSAGLILDRVPEEENYGVYVYCNDRLVVKHLKNHEVGFVKGQAGVPHPDASLCRVILRLTGAPDLMPWSSNKNALNYSHPTFLELREKIVFLTTYYSTLSRRMKNDREQGVYRHQSGDIEDVDLSQPGTEKQVVLPPVPRARKKPYADRLLEANANTIEIAPWTLGLVEAIGVVDGISRKNIDSKGRIALILLDSSLEIAMKEYIVHDAQKFPPEQFGDNRIAKLFRARHQVIDAIKPVPGVSEADWVKVAHYYNLRNKLIHERATAHVSTRDIEDYKTVVTRIISALFGLVFQV